MLDILVIIVILLTAFTGWRRGIILSVFSIAGYFISLSMARTYSPKVAGYLIENDGVVNGLNNFLDVPMNIARNYTVGALLNVFSFVVIFFIAYLIISSIGHFVNRVNRLPIIGKVNRFGGLAFGAIKGFLLIFIVLALLSFIVNIGNSRLGSTVKNTLIVNTMYENNPVLDAVNKMIESTDYKNLL